MEILYILIGILVILNIIQYLKLTNLNSYKKEATVVLEDVAKDGRVSYANQKTASKLTGVPAGPRPKSGRPRKRK